MPRQQLQFLVVMAHPHDFMHVAGTCGVHTMLGDKVTWVSMTAGVMTHNERLADELSKPLGEQNPSIVNQKPSEYAKEKAVELRQVGTLFGVRDVRILNYSDKPFVVERQPECVDEIRSLILELRPHVVLTQSPFLRGPHGLNAGTPNDHTETGFATMEGKLLAQMPRYGEGVAPHVTPAAFFPGVYFDKQHWDFSVDVSSFGETLIEAESLYKTQAHTEEYARRRITATVGNTGIYSGVLYAEAFVRERAETVSEIGLSDYSLRKATESRESHIHVSGIG